LRLVGLRVECVQLGGVVREQVEAILAGRVPLRECLALQVEFAQRRNAARIAPVSSSSRPLSSSNSRW